MTRTFSIDSSNIIPPYTHFSFDTGIFMRDLQQWVHLAPTREEWQKRGAASAKIYACYTNQETTLDLSNFSLTSLPTVIGHLTWLEDLNLQSNNLSFLPNELTLLIELTSLNLTNNQFSSPPSIVSNLPKLKTFYH
jgi:Leucine-rich repeat (LRR) protein